MKKILTCLFHLDHLVVSLFTLCVIGLMVFVSINVEFLNPMVRAAESFSMTDIYYRIQHSGTPTPNKLITLVDMTELGTRDRDKIATLIEQITAMKPTALGVDVIFEGRRDDDADTHLAEAFFHAPENTVLAYKLTDPDVASRSFGSAVHSFFAGWVGAAEGTVNVVSSPHKSLSKYPVFFVEHGDTLYSLPAQIARMMGIEFDKGEAEQTINYKSTAFPVVRWNELEQHRDLIENRIVLLGSTREEADKHFTPLGQMPGLEVTAYTLLSMLEGVDVEHGGFWVMMVWALMAGWLTNWIDFIMTKRMERRSSAIMIFITQSEFYDKFVSFLVMVAVTFVSFMLFVKLNYYVNTVLALSVIVLIEEGRLIYVGILSVLKKKGAKFIRHSLYFDDLEETFDKTK